MKRKGPTVLVCVFLAALGGAFPIIANEKDILVRWEPAQLTQGGISRLTVESSRPIVEIEAELSGAKLPLKVHPGGMMSDGLLGIDLDVRAGRNDLILCGRYRGGKAFRISRPVEIVKTEFETEHLTLPRDQVDLGEKTLARVQLEAKRLNEIWPKARAERLWSGQFIQPVEGPIGGLFGSRRILNGEPRSPHSGLDIRAPAGTPVGASNAGEVVLVDDLFFSGKTVVLDHGQGLYTMYFHLSEISVSKGKRVAKGECIGAVGATGRATGPHLHWGVRLGGARVSPAALVAATSNQ